MRLVFAVVLLCGALNVEAWLCTAGTPCMCHHPAAGSAVYDMGCLMSPCPAMSPINSMPAGSLFVHHPQINGCSGMIPGVFYNPGYGGGACIPIGSLDSGFPCCETTSGGFAAPNDPSCARDTVTISAPGAPGSGPHNGTHNHTRHHDTIHPQPRATSPHQGRAHKPTPHHEPNKHPKPGHQGKHGKAGKQGKHGKHDKAGKHHKGEETNHHPVDEPVNDVEPIVVSSVKPVAGHAYYIQNAVLCTMRFPPGDPHYTLIMCTAQCNEQFVFSGPSPDGNLAVGTIDGSPLCHGKTAVPWSCIMSTPDC